MCSFVCSISIYKSSQGCKKVRLQHFYTPDKSTVMSLACSPQGLYAGLVNGSVASYTKAPGKYPHSALTLGYKSQSHHEACYSCFQTHVTCSFLKGH